jgi:hypothetical protein
MLSSDPLLGFSSGHLPRDFITKISFSYMPRMTGVKGSYSGTE